MDKECEIGHLLPPTLKRVRSHYPRELHSGASSDTDSSSTNANETRVLVMRAKLAERAYRYDEMKTIVDKIAIEKKGQLTNEERRLLLAAWRHVTTRLRKSLQVVEASQNDAPVKGNEVLSDILSSYATKLEEKLQALCQNCIKILREHRYPYVAICDDQKGEESNSTVESRALYLKLLGDYNRYQAAFQDGEIFHKSTMAAKSSYEAALEASKKLKVTNVVRLEVALNFSVFFYNILNSPDKASEVAKEAYDMAATTMKSDEGLRNDSSGSNVKRIMQMLRENLRTWTDSAADGVRSMRRTGRGRSGEHRK